MSDDPKEFFKGFAEYLNDPQREVEAAQERAIMEPASRFIALQLGEDGFKGKDSDEIWWFSAESGDESRWSLYITSGAPGCVELTLMLKRDITLNEWDAFYAIVGYCTLHDIRLHNSSDVTPPPEPSER